MEALKILITGGSGFLGSKLVTLLSREHEVVGTFLKREKRDHVFLDITDKHQVNTVFSKLRPEVVIHTAGIADPDFCEIHREEAWRVNVEGTRNVVNACYDSKLVYISTDYVFNGEKGDYTEGDEARPINYYGLTKLEGEKIIQERLVDYLILRVPIFYGFNDEGDKITFLTDVLNKLRVGERVHTDHSQIRYPTWIDDIAETINRLIKWGLKGIYHFGSEEGLTKYEWALKIAEVYGLPSENIIKTRALQKAKRPHNSKLNISKIKELGIKPTGVEEGLLKTRKQMGCLFRMIYSVRPDMLILNESASLFRMNVGKRLAERHPVDADIVVGVPESGMFPASGYSMFSKIPFCFGLIRDYYTQKTIFIPNQEIRLEALRRKLIAVDDLVQNKRIVLIDEAIISGSTLSVAINKLREAGAKEIHVRIPSPPMVSNCPNGILNPNARLIWAQFSSEKELAEYLGVDSLRFLSLNEFLSLLPPKNEWCTDCFRILPQ